MVDWLFVDETISQLGFYLTTPSQLLLIFLTLFYVRKDLGAYKKMIILFAILGIVFATLEFVVCPILHNYNAGYIFFTIKRPLGVSNYILTILLEVYGSLYSFTISLLAVQFIYRYIAVFHSDSLKFFDGCYFILWVLYASSFGFQWAISLHKLDVADEYAKEYMRQDVIGVYNVDILKAPCVIHLVYQNYPNSTEKFVRWTNVIGTLSISSIMIIQYGVMAFCGWRLYAEMDEKLSLLSPEARKLHRQIFKTLVLQITTPTIVLFSPIVFAISITYFDLKLSLPTGVFLSGFTLYPALDAFILMYVITDYRRVFKNVLRMSKPSRVATNAITY